MWYVGWNAVLNGANKVFFAFVLNFVSKGGVCQLCSPYDSVLANAKYAFHMS